MYAQVVDAQVVDAQVVDAQVVDAQVVDCVKFPPRRMLRWWSTCSV